MEPGGEAWLYSGPDPTPSADGQASRSAPSQSQRQVRALAARTAGDLAVDLVARRLLRTSLRRSRADWPIVASAGLICVLAATLLAAGSIFAGAVSIAGLHRVLVDAPPAAGGIAVSSWVGADQTDAADATASTALEETFGPVGGRIDRLATTDSFALPDQPGGDRRELAVLGYAEGLADHASIVAGAWPDEVATDGSAVPVAVSRQVAEALGLAGRPAAPAGERHPARVVRPGPDRRRLRDRRPDRSLLVGRPQVLEGVVDERVVRHPRPVLHDEGGPRRERTARAGPAHLARDPGRGAVTLADVAGLRTRTADLRGRLDASMPAHVNVTTDLPAILATAERSLLVSRTGVVLLSVQLVVLAVYAVLLSASLLAEHRRVGNAMLRSRGAGTRQIVGLALIEGLLLTVPAALLAPWLAVAALGAFNLVGPLAAIGLSIAPSVTADAYVAAAVAAGSA